MSSEILEFLPPSEAAPGASLYANRVVGLEPVTAVSRVVSTLSSGAVMSSPGHKADELHLPKATGFQAPETRLRPFSCQ